MNQKVKLTKDTMGVFKGPNSFQTEPLEAGTEFTLKACGLQDNVPDHPAMGLFWCELDGINYLIEGSLLEIVEGQNGVKVDG